jgi:hypothetical protein
MKKLLLTIALALTGSGGLISSAQAHPGENHCGGYHCGQRYCGDYYGYCGDYDDNDGCGYHFYWHNEHRSGHRR